MRFKFTGESIIDVRRESSAGVLFTLVGCGKEKLKIKFDFKMKKKIKLKITLE